MPAGHLLQQSFGVVLLHGDEAVLGHDEIDADKAGLAGVHALLYGFKSQQCLRKDLPGRKAAENLVNEANFDLAGGCGLGRAAVLDIAS